MVMLRLPLPMRPAIGGLFVGGLALLTPQVLSSGHGALHVAARGLLLDVAPPAAKLAIG